LQGRRHSGLQGCSSISQESGKLLPQKYSLLPQGTGVFSKPNLFPEQLVKAFPSHRGSGSQGYSLVSQGCWSSQRKSTLLTWSALLSQGMNATNATTKINEEVCWGDVMSLGFAVYFRRGVQSFYMGVPVRRGATSLRRGASSRIVFFFRASTSTEIILFGSHTCPCPLFRLGSANRLRPFFSFLGIGLKLHCCEYLSYLSVRVFVFVSFPSFRLSFSSRLHLDLFFMFCFLYFFFCIPLHALRPFGVRLRSGGGNAALPRTR
jgi:hypothetical protein